MNNFLKKPLDKTAFIEYIITMKETMKTQQEPVMAILVGDPSNKLMAGIEQLQRIQAKKQELTEVKKSIESHQFEIPQGPALINGQWS